MPEPGPSALYHDSGVAGDGSTCGRFLQRPLDPRRGVVSCCPGLPPSQELDVARRAQQRGDHQPAQAQPQLRQRRADLYQHLPMYGGIAHHAPLAHLRAARLELRFDERDDLPPPSRSQRTAIG